MSIEYSDVIRTATMAFYTYIYALNQTQGWVWDLLVITNWLNLPWVWNLRPESGSEPEYESEICQ